MNLEITVTIGIFIISGLFGIIFFSVKRWIATIGEGITHLEASIQKLKDDLSNNKLDNQKTFATCEALDRVTGDNKQSHALQWAELNQVKERVTRIETKIEDKKS